MKRVAVAVLGVVALVAAAFGLRALRADDGAGPDDGLDVSPRVLLCAPEMAEACTVLADATVQVRIESPGATVQRLRAGGSLEGDGWLAPRPWIDLGRDAALAAGRGDPFAAVSDTLARSDLVLIVRSDRRPTLERTCGGAGIAWSCLAQHAGDPWSTLGGSDAWGTVRVGIDDPASATTGRLALAQMARAFAHRDTIDARDLETVRSTIATLAPRLIAAGADRSALATMLEVGDSFDLVVALEATTRVAIASPRASGQLELVELGPATAADAVLATATTAAPTTGATGGGSGAGTSGGGGRLSLDHEQVRRALTSTGWHFADKTASGTPGAATLDALLDLWRSVRTG